jgi:hypothetical protein
MFTKLPATPTLYPIGKPAITFCENRTLFHSFIMEPPWQRLSLTPLVAAKANVSNPFDVYCRVGVHLFRTFK